MPNSPTPPANLYYRLAKFFVTNRQLALLLTLASFAFGILAFIATPKQYNPEITLPAFRITTAFPYATADEVERLVTSEIENKLAEIPGVDEITSQSFSGGVSVVNVMFEIGNELEASKTKVTEKMTSGMNLAPLGVGAPLISQINPENVPVATYAITSTKYTAEGLRDFAYDLREKIKTVDGVTNIDVTGGRTRAFAVTLDPDRITARGVAINDVTQTISANNLRTVVGRIEGATQNLTVEVDGNLTVDALKKLRVGGTGDAAIYLDDVATVADSDTPIESYTRFVDRKTTDNTATVYLSYAKKEGVNIGDVTAAVEERIDVLTRDRFVPEGVTLTLTRDEGATAREEITLLTEHLALAVTIVTVTLIFFLGWRAALVVAFAIPLTLVLVFIVGYLFDQSINRITLFALIFSLGLLVDDAIVVVENIYRHFHKKDTSRTEAIARATGEVGMGVFLATITAVIVFAPMGLVTGMMGAYMGPIAFFAPVARLASLVVAYTFSPYLASLFLRESDAHDEAHVSRLDAWYRRLIQSILGNRRTQNALIAGVIALVVFAFSLPVVEFVHFRMLPKADKEQLYVWLDTPETTTLATTNELAARVETFALKNKNITSVETTVGAPPVLDFNGLFRGADARTNPYQATLKLNLLPKGERDETSEEIVARLRPDIQKLFVDEPDTRVKLVEDPPGPPVLSTLLLRVKGDDPIVREAIARDLLGWLRATPGVTDIDSSLAGGATERLINIDHEKLTHSGLNVADVIATLTTGLRGQPVAIAHTGSRERTNIVVRLAPDARDEPTDLDRIFLRNTRGEMVALSSVTTTTTAPTAAPIWHDAREPMTIVAGEMSGRSVVYAAKDLIFKLLDYPNNQPACQTKQLETGNCKLETTSWNLFGFTYRDTQSGATYTVEWGGEFEMTLENFRDLGIAMIVAYFLIYVVLVAQFQNFRAAGLIMTTILLGFAGVLPGFAILDLVSGTYFSATSMIGIIALGGIVVGNAIILLDFIEQLRARGLTLESAIVEACQTRLRPILLTAVTAVLGALVIVADPVWSGLAWALTFGLSISTVLTLVIFPVLYARWGADDLR